MTATQTPSERGRAWIEVSLPALRHNVSELQRRQPAGCRLMAVIKADAYGHGAERVASELAPLGVTSLAVATVAEGAALRESGIAGDILVLGPTSADDAPLLARHRLAQLLTGPAHARELGNTGCKIDTHIAVDTGMHRVGFDDKGLWDIERAFKHDTLTVCGMATHLATSDSLSPGDEAFTAEQIERFFTVVTWLRRRGYDTGKLHIASSYGVYNYPDLSCDYARVGIALYGVMSGNAETRIAHNLHPMLSLRARLSDIRQIGADETVSYGRTFRAEKPMKIAAVTVGYADGVPRQLSGSGAYMLVRGKKAPVLGRVCMDLCVVDVTDIPDAAFGDVVTVIGRDGGEEVRCEDFAGWSGTITNDILSRLGARLPRLYIGY